MKILVELTVPVIGETYEIWVPKHLKIKMLTQMTVKSVRALSGEKYVPSGTERLCFRGEAKLLDPDLTLMDYNIKNGDQLLLI